MSRLNQRIYEQIDAWRQRPITGTYPYVYLDGVSLKRSWGGEVRNVSVLMAIGVGTDGYRNILGVAEGEKEDLEGWRSFLRYLKSRGLTGVQLIISDACLGQPSRQPKDSSRRYHPPSVSMSGNWFTTSQQWFTCVRLSDPHLSSHARRVPNAHDQIS